MKKKKRGESSAASIEISKDYFVCLLEVLKTSDIKMSSVLYRKLLNHFFEGMVMLDNKSKNMTMNRELILNYLEVMFKLLVQKNVEIGYSQVQEELGKPDIFPLKLNLEKNKFYGKSNASRSSIMKFERLNSLTSASFKKTIFLKKQHLAFSLFTFKKIASSAQRILGFEIQDSLQKLMKGLKTNTPVTKRNLFLEFDKIVK